MASSDDLRLPGELREGLVDHLRNLRASFRERGVGARMGFGQRPAIVVVDLFKGETDSSYALGSNLDSVVEQTRRILDAARAASVPIFFTVMGYDPDDPQGPWDLKQPGLRSLSDPTSGVTELDPRLGRLPTEKLFAKKYTSCFKGTDLYQMLVGQGVDTLIVTGCSTSHCINDTCRDAMSSFKVVVPEEAVGDRCELMHLAELMDLDMFAADVVLTGDVLVYLEGLPAAREAVTPA